MSGKTPGRRKVVDCVQEENPVQAVVIADCYRNNFFPLGSPKCLLPLVNRPLLDYTLKSLSQAGVNEVILFCSAYANKIKDFVRKEKWGRMSVSVVVSEGCRSLGDAIRDLDAKSIIRADFILITGDLIGNVQLLKALETHKKHVAADKSTAMTLIYKECGKKFKTEEDEIFLVSDTDTNRLLSYFKNPDMKQKLKIPLETLLDEGVGCGGAVDMRCDLIDTGIAICSVAVPPLFSDNFDFQTKDDFIRGLLMNDEIIESSGVYCYIINNSEYAATVSNWHNYHTVSHDVIHRWTYPQVPDDTSYNDPYSYRRNNLYTQQGVTLGNVSNIMEDVVIASGTTVSDNATLSSCVIGKNCKIFENASISNSYLFDNVIVKSGASLEYCVVGQGCRIMEGVKLRHCILGNGVVEQPDKELTRLRLVNAADHRLSDSKSGSGEKGSKGEFELNDDEEEFEDESDNEGNGMENDRKSPSQKNNDWIGLTGYQGDNEQGTGVESDSDSDDFEHDQLSDKESILQDDTNLFYNEVVDSLIRGFEDKINCDNLILEVNSSRYAYNVSLSELNYHLVRALLSLQSQIPQQKNRTSVDIWDTLALSLNHFLPLIRNYIRNSSAMKDCLSALEDVAETDANVKLFAVKILDILYDKDVLDEESIMLWYKTPRDDSTFAVQFRKQVTPFIRWLEEADEQSSSEEEE